MAKRDANPKGPARSAWLVDYGNGELEVLRYFASARVVWSTDSSAGSLRRTLTRLAPGVYYYVVAYDTPDGPRPRLVTVRRISARRAREELTQQRLEFEERYAATAAAFVNGL